MATTNSANRLVDTPQTVTELMASTNNASSLVHRTKASFLKLPAELRLLVYDFCTMDWFIMRHCWLSCIPGRLPIANACRKTRNEYIDAFFKSPLLPFVMTELQPYMEIDFDSSEFRRYSCTKVERIRRQQKEAKEELRSIAIWFITTVPDDKMYRIGRLYTGYSVGTMTMPHFMRWFDLTLDWEREQRCRVGISDEDLFGPGSTLSEARAATAEKMQRIMDDIAQVNGRLEPGQVRTLLETVDTQMIYKLIIEVENNFGRQ